MRLNRTTFFALGGLLVFIVLALVVLNNPTLAPGNTPTPDSVSAAVLPAIDLDRVQRVTLAGIDTTLVIVQNADGSWGVEGNPNPAEQVALDTAISNIITLQSAQSFPVEGALAAYGLDIPALTVTINDGIQDYKLRIGSQNPSATRTYALAGDDDSTVYLLTNPSAIATLTGYLTTPPVVVIVPTAAPALDQAGLLFPAYDPQRTVQVSLVNNDTQDNLILVKQADGTWALDPFSTSYSAQPLDQTLASTIAAVFGGIQALDVLSNVSDEAALGLDTPAYTLTATRDDDYAYTIQVGNPDPSGARQYARIFELPNVAVIDRGDLSSLIQFIGAPPFVQTLPAEATAEATDSN